MFKTKTALEVIRSNKECLSGLTKNCGKIAVEVAIGRLLKELVSLTLSPATPPQLAAMAAQIRENFYWLRFEEVQYCLNKGINGAYGYENKNLAYETISKWLTEYDGVERMDAVNMKHDEKAANNVTISKEETPDELLYLNAKYTGRKVEPEKTKEQKLKDLDQGQWTMFWQEKDSISTPDLEKLLVQCTESNLTKTAEAITNELTKRKSNDRPSGGTEKGE